ncbi:putative Helicase [Leptomonas pyrrhocoris]|uniref:Putative Helicase n=1 Tax=Leptomonas pyrrhocoris TaxID=157538 RepID=A0A0M9G3D9_LEPPY|nr:putative Helicase [Leptomonas pyrrhocoris]KPA81600.1 putative Helicase [Leptomonas pyrrhocoris]|eukprot:XP_015660039.1 putative Helicase [Leptomonas pyrrhocoris]
MEQLEEKSTIVSVAAHPAAAALPSLHPTSVYEACTAATVANTPAQAADDFAVLVPLLQRARTQRLPPPSFTSAPAVPLPLWQQVVLSSLNARKTTMQEQQKFKNIRQKVSKELTRYHLELQERAERQRQQQREARAQAGERVAAGVRRFWSRRGDGYQQLMRVEFDVVKHQHDRRKQEDLLRETEALTRKLLESFFNASNKTAASASPLTDASPAAMTSPVNTTAKKVRGSADALDPLESPDSAYHNGSSFWAQVGDDDDVPIEHALSLLDTDQGRRPLRHYQRSSLRWMVHLYENNLNGILADEMGLGKTVQTIALLCYFAEYRNDWGPHLIVVPTTVVLNWKAELDRWAPGLKVLTYIGGAKERHQLRKGWTSEDAFHVCVTSYNLVVQDRKVFRRRPWGFLVLDEAHQVKNFMSIKWQSLFDLQAEYRLLLTGTPLQNSIMELWSLFHFLLPFASAFRSNAEFKEWFSNPMDAMITGRSSLNEDIVRRLQALIRPFMLRRLKKDVESQLPTKTEKVVLCQLSRRQRSLYDDYMQLADTRQKLRGGGAGGVLSVLLALRKVCDHPDLFEERPTVSPFVLGYEARVEQVVPRAVLLHGNATMTTGESRFPCFYVDDVNEDDCACQYETAQEEENARCGARRRSNACGVARAHRNASSCLFFASLAGSSSMPWWAAQPLVDLPAVTNAQGLTNFAERFRPPVSWKGNTRFLSPLKANRGKVAGSGQPGPRQCDGSTLHAAYLAALQASAGASASRAHRTAAAQRLRYHAMQCARNIHTPQPCELDLCQTRLARNFPALCPNIADRAAALFPVVEKMCVYVPAVLAPHAPRLRWLLPVTNTAPYESLDRTACATLIGAVAKRQDAHLSGRRPPRQTYDAAFFLRELWAIQVRRSFSFPDKRLLIHDCGKLQFLEAALKEMRQEAHRALIFTQFVHMLNILERFLALIGVAYLRLDGSTKAEVRQQLVDRFNADARVTCMILSTRSGGVGLNLTGADTVIFYDSDWNPTMDLQAQDRCHRIGQTRPVTIYRLISEHTVEESILRKARERKKLNNVVIRGGQFHTIAGVNEQFDDSAAAFAALSDPVNLRSFFHDLDEDATVADADATSTAGATPTTGFSMLEEMANVEDEEDRMAGQEFQREIAEREAQEAAAGESDDDDEGRGGDPLQGKRVWFDHEGDGVHTPRTAESQQASVAVVDSAAAAAAWRRKGPNTLRDLYLWSRTEASRTDIVAATGNTHTPAQGAETDKVVRLAVRKRQREMVRKAALPVDQFVTLQYGRCQREDAEDRYDALVEAYTAQMDEMDSHADDEDGDEEGASSARLPRFRAVYRLGST